MVLFVMLVKILGNNFLINGENKMRMLKTGKGTLDIQKSVNWLILLIVGFVVIFKLAATLIPEGQTAGDELNASGVPLGSFFVSDGIVWLLVMVAIVLLVVKTSMGGNK